MDNLRDGSKILDAFVACGIEDGGFLSRDLWNMCVASGFSVDNTSSKYKELYNKLREVERDLDARPLAIFVDKVAERVEEYPQLYPALPEWLIYKKEVALANIKNGPCFAEYLSEKFRTKEFLKIHENQDEFFEYVPLNIRADLFPNYNGDFDINIEYIESFW